MKISLKENLPFIAGILVIAITTIVEGRWSERWSTLEEVQQNAAKLADVPLRVGEWQGKEVKGPDADILKVAGAAGSFSRVYENLQHDVVSVFMVCGRPLEMFEHTPDVCYPAAGFETMDQPVVTQLDAAGAATEFSVATFMKSEQSNSQRVQVYWTYGIRNEWSTPKNIRHAFGGAWGLYKLYVVIPVTAAEPPLDGNPATDFIRAFLPEANRVLFQPEAAIPATAAEAPAAAQPKAEATEPTAPAKAS